MFFLFIAKQVLTLVILLLAAAGMGKLVRLVEDRHSCLSSFSALDKRTDKSACPPLVCALGLALLAHLFFFLALIGQLLFAPVVLLLVIAAVVPHPAFGHPLPRGEGSEGHELKCLLPAGEGGRRPDEVRLSVAVIVVVCASLFLLTLYPPLAFDETLYHLPFVRALAESGRLEFLTDFRFPVFPQFQELLCVPLFMTAGDVSTHLVPLAEVAITAALLFEWGGPLAAALFLGSPIVVQLATITYVDAALALFVAAGFYCLDRERFALAGLFLGTACSVKYLGGYFAVAALLLVVIFNRRKTIAFAASCLAAALPTTLWLTITTGDPLFPFLRSSPWLIREPHAALDVHIVRVLRVLWDVTFARARVNQQPPFTPFLIIVVIIVIAAAVRDVRARCIAFIAAAYLVVFSFLPQDSRYLVPLLPLLSVVAARSLKRATVLAPIAVAPGALYIIYVLALRGMPPASRDAMLTERVPEYAALTRAGDGTVYVCGAEQLKYYARGRLLGDFFGPYSFQRVLADHHDTAAIARSLRRIDAEYFLVAKRACAPPLRNGGMDLVFEDGAAQLWRVQRSQSSP